MITKAEIEAFLKHVDSLGLKFPVAALSKATGYSKGNVSEYLKSADPSENFIKAVYKAFPKGSENVPPGTVSSGNESKYVALLERENERLRKDLELSLGELRHNILLTRAIAETNQELLVEALSGKNKKVHDDLAYKTSIRNGEKYQKMKGEGKFSDVGT